MADTFTLRGRKQTVMVDIRTSYLSRYLEPCRSVDTAKQAVAALRHHDYDAIAFRGMSGALIAPLVAALTGKPLIMVRKSNTGHHSGRWVEGADRLVEDRTKPLRYIIVDDFVSSGATARAIVNAIKTHHAPNAKCLGVLCCNGLPGMRYFRTHKEPYALRQV